MKIRSIALAAVALAMMSCGGGMKKAAFTTISGTVEDTTLTEVRVTVASPKLDTDNGFIHCSLYYIMKKN